MKKEKETENEKRNKARKSSEERKHKNGKKNLKIVVKTDPSYLGWSIYGLLAAHFGDFF